MKRFEATCVIDAMPETHSVRDFVKRFNGRVYLCYYQDTLKSGEYKLVDRDEHGVGVVNVHRTELLDTTLKQIRDQGIILPAKTQKIEDLASNQDSQIWRHTTEIQ